MILAFLFACKMGDTNPNGNTGNPPGDAPYEEHTILNKSGDRLKIGILKGDDGSVHQFSVFDSELNTKCNFANAEDSQWRCIPFGLNISRQLFWDTGCTKNLATTQCEENTSFAYESLGCDGNGRTKYRVYRTTSEYTGTVYQKAGDQCVESGFQGRKFKISDAPVPASEFVKGSFVLSE